MDGKKIISSFVPYKVNNPYARNVMDILNNNGVETYPIKECFSSLSNFRRTSVYNFNWFENMEKKGLSSLAEFYAKMAILQLLKLTRKKIVYTLHNKLPHHSSSNKYSGKLMRWLAKNSDAIVIMSEDSRQVVDDLVRNDTAARKIYKIPHPTYCNNYDLNKSENLREKFGINKENIVFMFMGSISPYKNIEILIEAFKSLDNPQSNLIIAGRPLSAEYGDALKNLIGDNKRVIPIFEYIPDEDMELYYNTSDIVVLPYSKVSSLNSGALYLSFTFSKTVICPEIGSVNDITDKSILYHYDYTTVNEHKEKLLLCMQEACKKNEEQPGSLLEQGKRAFTYLMENHNDEIISELYEQLYTQLTSK